MKRPEDMIAARKEFYQKIESNELSLAETLKAMRKLLGKTQKEFAELIDVALPAIRAIEQEKGNPTLSTLTKISEPFGLRVGLVRKNF